jgi:hypothetical protein
VPDAAAGELIQYKCSDFERVDRRSDADFRELAPGPPRALAPGMRKIILLVVLLAGCGGAWAEAAPSGEPPEIDNSWVYDQRAQMAADAAANAQLVQQMNDLATAQVQQAQMFVDQSWQAAHDLDMQMQALQQQQQNQ